MHEDRVEIGEEVGAKKTFVWVIDWPGWCRGGKDPTLAIDALVLAGPRYAAVATAAGLALPDVSAPDLSTVESHGGGAGTDFGVPSVIGPSDRRPTTAAEAERLTALVAAAWTTFDAVAAAAPLALRLGPRGGGRDRDGVVAHVVRADHAYAHQIGVRGSEPDPTDALAVEAERAAMLDVLRQPSDGLPLAERKWPARYAARRIAWHALDHAWEIEDRTER